MCCNLPKFTIVSLYMPHMGYQEHVWESCLMELERLMECRPREFLNSPVVIGMDANVIIPRADGWGDAVGCGAQDVPNLGGLQYGRAAKLMEVVGAMNVRLVNTMGETVEFTHQHKATRCWSVLDYVAASPVLQGQCHVVQGLAASSDHLPLLYTFSPPTTVTIQLRQKSRKGWRPLTAEDSANFCSKVSSAIGEAGNLHGVKGLCRKLQAPLLSPTASAGAGAGGNCRVTCWSFRG